MRGVLGVLLLVPLIVLVLVGSLLSGVAALLTPDRTLAALDRAEVATAIRAAVLTQSAEGNLGEGLRASGVGDSTAFRDVVLNAVPAEQVNAWIHQAVPALYTWLDGTEATPSVNLDLTATKARLQSGLNAYLKQHVSTIQACSATDAAAKARGEKPLCRSPGETDAVLLDRIQTSGAVEELVRRIPDQVDAANLGPLAASASGTASNVPTPTDPSLLRLRTLYQERGAIVGSVWLVVAFLFLLEGLLHRSPIRRILHWLSATFLVTGFGPLLIGAFGAFALPPVDIGSRLPPEFPPEARDAVVRLVGAAIGEIARVPFLVGSAFVLLGILGLAASFFHHSQPPHHARG